jgi:hypothetical protein
MSVINNVLKDLETRESRFTPIELTSVQTPSPVRRDLKPLALGASLLIVVAAGAWVYLQPRIAPGVAGPVALASIDTAPVMAAPKDEIQAAEISAARVTAPVETLDAGVVTDRMIGNQIIGLQIRESEQDMRMEFVLRDKVVAYLQERGENSFGYHLRGIESQIVAPVMTDNPWVRTLSINGTERGVDIEFETAPDILVETRQSLIDDEPVWIINLRKAVAPAPVKAEPAAATESVASAAIEASTSPGSLPGESRQLAPTVAPTPAADDAGASPVPVVKLEIKSTSPGAKSANQLDYAVELIRSSRPDDAENLLQGLLGGTEDFGARRHLLALYQGQQRVDRFERLARESVARYPDEALFRTEYARSLFDKAAYRAAIQQLSGGPALDSSQQSLVAASYQRLDEHADAIRHYRLALGQDAANAKNWIGLAISQEHSSQFEAALDSYQRARRLGNLDARLQAFVDKRSDTLSQVLN